MINTFQQIDTTENITLIETYIRHAGDTFKAVYEDPANFSMNPILVHQLKEISTYIRRLGQPLFKKVLEGTYPDENIDIAALESAKEMLNSIPNSSFISTVLDYLKSGNKKYPRVTKNIGLFIYLHVGPTMYPFFQKNFFLPSLTLVKNYLKDEFEMIIEGELRVNQLQQWLERHNLPPVVWISEDATRVIPKVRHISTSASY